MVFLLQNLNLKYMEKVGMDSMSAEKNTRQFSRQKFLLHVLIMRFPKKKVDLVFGVAVFADIFQQQLLLISSGLTGIKIHTQRAVKLNVKINV